MYFLRLLGGIAVDGAEGVLAGPITHRHRLALLALLAESNPPVKSREKLCAYLWPERPAERARNLLNQAVHGLRKRLGEGAVVSTADGLRLAPELVGCDVRELEEALAAKDWERAVELYAGPFLDGFFLDGAAEFERWADGERERLRRAFVGALESLAELAESRGDTRGAVECWQRLVAHDPYSARRTLGLMRALELAGDRAAAIRQASLHAELLERELEAQPNPDVLALAERMRRAPEQRPRRVEAPAAETASESAGAVRPEAGSAAAPEPVSAATESDPPGPVISPSADPRPAARRRSHHAWAALGAIAGAVVLLVSLSQRHSATSFDPERVVVVPFENRTRDATLDPVGLMAADWVTQGLSRTRFIDVVPVTAALAAAQRPDMREAGSSADPLRALAEETGAGVVVSGAYYLQGDSLRIQAQITDPREGRVLRALEPIVAPRAAPLRAIELLRRHTMGALAHILHGPPEIPARTAQTPPSYAAYVEFAEGMELIVKRRWREAIEPLERAAATDSAYLSPRVQIALAYYNSGELNIADSVARSLVGSRDRLDPWDRAVLDLTLAFLNADRQAEYEAAKTMATLNPKGVERAQVGGAALSLGRPREAVRVLSGIDPTRGVMRDWTIYWVWLTEALHVLGEHRRELREARRARSLDPDEPSYLFVEARALVALDRPSEAEALVDSAQSMPAIPAERKVVLIWSLVTELRAHGHDAAVTAMSVRGVRLCDGLPPEGRYWNDGTCADLLLQAGRVDSAEAAYRRALSAHSLDGYGIDDDYNFEGLGVIAARRADVAEAERIMAELAAIDGPGQTQAEATMGRAAIAAHLGRKDEAVRLVRQALSEGVRYGMALHAWHMLGPLRDYPPFQELRRPKG